MYNFLFFQFVFFIFARHLHDNIVCVLSCAVLHKVGYFLSFLIRDILSIFNRLSFIYISQWFHNWYSKFDNFFNCSWMCWHRSKCDIRFSLWSPKISFKILPKCSSVIRFECKSNSNINLIVFCDIFSDIKKYKNCMKIWLRLENVWISQFFESDSFVVSAINRSSVVRFRKEIYAKQMFSTKLICRCSRFHWINVPNSFKTRMNHSTGWTKTNLLKSIRIRCLWCVHHVSKNESTGKRVQLISYLQWNDTVKWKFIVF